MIRLFSKLLGLLLFSALLPGCSDHQKVSGTVTYPDGTPLTQGFVYFDSTTELFQARGEIMNDGSYQLGSVKANDGIPSGKYMVFVISERRGDQGRIPLVAPKYNSGSTSEIVCEIPVPKGKFDFTVEPFEGKIKGDPLAPFEIKPESELMRKR